MGNTLLTLSTPDLDGFVSVDEDGLNTVLLDVFTLFSLWWLLPFGYHLKVNIYYYYIRHPS